MTSSFGKLADGTNQLANGTEKLADGSSALTDNLSKLTVGTSDLSNGLSDAGDKLSAVSTKEDNAKTLVDPLTLSKTDENKVEKNGIGMAPYMISVALFVAAISTNIIFSTLPSGQEPRTETRLAEGPHRGKWSNFRRGRCFGLWCCALDRPIC